MLRPLDQRLSQSEEYLLRFLVADWPAWYHEIQASKPRGILVGEAPGAHGADDCPLFPYPSHGVGARLASFFATGEASAKWNATNLVMKLKYLTSFHRVNLLDVYPGTQWSEATRGDAFRRATYIRGQAWAANLPIVAIGLNARRVFGMSSNDEPAKLSSYLYGPAKIGRCLQLAWLPHPSGRNRQSNDPVVRQQIGKLLRSIAEC